MMMIMMVLTMLIRHFSTKSKQKDVPKRFFLPHRRRKRERSSFAGLCSLQLKGFRAHVVTLIVIMIMTVTTFLSCGFFFLLSFEFALDEAIITSFLIFSL